MTTADELTGDRLPEPDTSVLRAQPSDPDKDNASGPSAAAVPSSSRPHARNDTISGHGHSNHVDSLAKPSAPIDGGHAHDEMMAGDSPPRPFGLGAQPPAVPSADSRPEDKGIKASRDKEDLLPGLANGPKSIKKRRRVAKKKSKGGIEPDDLMDVSLTSDTPQPPVLNASAAVSDDKAPDEAVPGPAAVDGRSAAGPMAVDDAQEPHKKRKLDEEGLGGGDGEGVVKKPKNDFMPSPPAPFHEPRPQSPQPGESQQSLDSQTADGASPQPLAASAHPAAKVKVMSLKKKGDKGEPSPACGKPVRLSTRSKKKKDKKATSHSGTKEDGSSAATAKTPTPSPTDSHSRGPLSPVGHAVAAPPMAAAAAGASEPYLKSVFVTEEMVRTLKALDVSLRHLLGLKLKLQPPPGWHNASAKAKIAPIWELQLYDCSPSFEEHRLQLTADPSPSPASLEQRQTILTSWLRVIGALHDPSASPTAEQPADSTAPTSRIERFKQSVVSVFLSVPDWRLSFIAGYRGEMGRLVRDGEDRMRELGQVLESVKGKWQMHGLEVVKQGGMPKKVLLQGGPLAALDAVTSLWNEVRERSDVAAIQVPYYLKRPVLNWLQRADKERNKNQMIYWVIGSGSPPYMLDEQVERCALYAQLLAALHMDIDAQALRRAADHTQVALHDDASSPLPDCFHPCRERASLPADQLVWIALGGARDTLAKEVDDIKGKVLNTPVIDFDICPLTDPSLDIAHLERIGECILEAQQLKGAVHMPRVKVPDGHQHQPTSKGPSMLFVLDPANWGYKEGGGAGFISDPKVAKAKGHLTQLANYVREFLVKGSRVGLNSIEGKHRALLDRKRHKNQEQAGTRGEEDKGKGKSAAEARAEYSDRLALNQMILGAGQIGLSSYTQESERLKQSYIDNRPNSQLVGVPGQPPPPPPPFTPAPPPEDGFDLAFEDCQPPLFSFPCEAISADKWLHGEHLMEEAQQRQQDRNHLTRRPAFGKELFVSRYAERASTVISADGVRGMLQSLMRVHAPAPPPSPPRKPKVTAPPISEDPMCGDVSEEPPIPGVTEPSPWLPKPARREAPEGLETVSSDEDDRKDDKRPKQSSNKPDFTLGFGAGSVSYSPQGAARPRRPPDAGKQPRPFSSTSSITSEHPSLPPVPTESPPPAPSDPPARATSPKQAAQGGSDKSAPAAAAEDAKADAAKDARQGGGAVGEAAPGHQKEVAAKAATSPHRKGRADDDGMKAKGDSKDNERREAVKVSRKRALGDRRHAQDIKSRSRSRSSAHKRRRREEAERRGRHERHSKDKGSNSDEDESDEHHRERRRHKKHHHHHHHHSADKQHRKKKHRHSSSSEESSSDSDSGRRHRRGAESDDGKRPRGREPISRDLSRDRGDTRDDDRRPRHDDDRRHRGRDDIDRRPRNPFGWSPPHPHRPSPPKNRLGDRGAQPNDRPDNDRASRDNGPQRMVATDSRGDRGGERDRERDRDDRQSMRGRERSPHRREAGREKRLLGDHIPRGQK
ncbi:unnamed protein product [Vitrella brassicaformis CCMP3155]|uniref:Uncharacterized protein n=1 Tax=Vitrella brassicaformis (strain CCMP3155) TaxID=1169540 RepID=A0A0G4ENH5_VITBC|nr:unnamed protein product [Vitrella brassicaformis CCMP3155]|eukprot:CEL99138.1 unnamed protein product [Vitrella brassicaformis CCMP3155]